ncbi:MAG: WG repeat-containing protein [Marinilabiliaceae bacterium]|nr:WG repeat-containing protein [Marinilabiliaceae bacterium]
METRTRLIITIMLLAVGIGNYAQEPTYKKEGEPDELGWYKVSEKKKFGFIDEKGNIVVPIIYEGTGWVYSDGLLLVRKNKWGYVNRQGQEVIPLIYDEAHPFSNGVARIKRDKKCGIIDTTGAEILPIVYDEIKNFSWGAALVKREGKWGVIDTTYREICKPVYDDIGIFGEVLFDFAFVKREDKWGIIDMQWKEVIPAQYEAIIFDEGLAPLRGHGKIGFINERCKMVIPADYDDCTYFSNGSVAVKQNGLWGYIDREGKIVIPCKLNYEQYGPYSEGLIAVMRNKKWGYIDTAEKVVIPIKLNYDKVFGFSEGMAKVMKKDKYGFINLAGKEVIKPKYIAAIDFENGVTVATKVMVNLDIEAELRATAAALQGMADQLFAVSTAMMSMSALEQQRVYHGPTGGNLQAEQKKQRWEQQFQQKQREIENKYNSDMQRAAMQRAAGANIRNNLSTIVPEHILIDKSGKELLRSNRRFTSVVKLDSVPGNWYLLTRAYGIGKFGEWGGGLRNYYGIYDLDQKKEIVRSNFYYSRFDMATFEEKGWIVVATAKSSFKDPLKHLFGIIDYSDNVVIPLEHEIFDVTVFYPHERILVGDVLKGKITFILGVTGGYTVIETTYGIIDYSGKVIIPKTIAEGIELIDNSFVMTLREGDKLYFDLDGREIRK